MWDAAIDRSYAYKFNTKVQKFTFMKWCATAAKPSQPNSFIVDPTHATFVGSCVVCSSLTLFRLGVQINRVKEILVSKYYAVVITNR